MLRHPRIANHDNTPAQFKQPTSPEYQAWLAKHGKDPVVVHCNFNFSGSASYLDDVNVGFAVETPSLFYFSSDDKDKQSKVDLLKSFVQLAASGALLLGHGTKFEGINIGTITEGHLLPIKTVCRIYDAGSFFAFVKLVCEKLNMPLPDPWSGPILPPKREFFAQASAELYGAIDAKNVKNMTGHYDITVSYNTENITSKVSINNILLGFDPTHSVSKKETYAGNLDSIEHTLNIIKELKGGQVTFSDRSMFMLVLTDGNTQIYQLNNINSLQMVYNILLECYKHHHKNQHVEINKSAVLTQSSAKPSAQAKVLNSTDDCPDIYVNIQGHAEEGLYFTKDYHLFVNACFDFKSLDPTLIQLLKGYCQIPMPFYGESIENRKIDFGTSYCTIEDKYFFLDLTRYQNTITNLFGYKPTTSKLVQKTNDTKISCVAGQFYIDVARRKPDGDDDVAPLFFVQYKSIMDCPSLVIGNCSEVYASTAKHLQVIADDLSALGASDNDDVYTPPFNYVIFTFNDGTSKEFYINTIAALKAFIPQALQFMGYELITPQIAPKVIDNYIVNNRTPLLGSPNVLQFSKSGHEAMPGNDHNAKQNSRWLACLNC